MEAFGMAGMRYRKAGQVAGAGLLRSYEATAMIEDAGWRRDMRGIMPAPELPTLRQPLLEAPGATGHATPTPPQVEPQRLSRAGAVGPSIWIRVEADGLKADC
jgi:hypothetical protein